MTRDLLRESDGNLQGRFSRPPEDVRTGLSDSRNTFGGFHEGVPPQGNRNNYVPLYKWGLTFIGSGLLNANQILERVEELAGTCRVPREELFFGHSRIALRRGFSLVPYSHTPH